MQISDSTKHTLDLASGMTVVATLLSWLPHIAAIVSIVWGLIRIYETDTVQGIVRHYRAGKKAGESKE